MRFLAALVTIGVFGGTASAALTLTVGTPAANGLYTDSVEITATASSLYEVVVTASAGANTTTLDAISLTDFAGTLSLAGLPEGDVTVTITATEKAPGTGTATVLRVIRHDIPP